MPRLLLEHVTIRGGKIDFVDRRKTSPATVRAVSLAIDLEEWTTLPERTGGYLVSGRTKAGESLKWRGTISLHPIRSEGSLKSEAVKAANGPQQAHFWR
jgi:hypothetical protein